MKKIYTLLCALFIITTNIIAQGINQDPVIEYSVAQNEYDGDAYTVKGGTIGGPITGPSGVQNAINGTTGQMIAINAPAFTPISEILYLANGGHAFTGIHNATQDTCYVSNPSFGSSLIAEILPSGVNTPNKDYIFSLDGRPGFANYRVVPGNRYLDVYLRTQQGTYDIIKTISLGFGINVSHVKSTSENQLIVITSNGAQYLYQLFYDPFLNEVIQKDFDLLAQGIYLEAVDLVEVSENQVVIGGSLYYTDINQMLNNRVCTFDLDTNLANNQRFNFWFQAGYLQSSILQLTYIDEGSVFGSGILVYNSTPIDQYFTFNDGSVVHIESGLSLLNTNNQVTRLVLGEITDIRGNCTSLYTQNGVVYMGTLSSITSGPLKLLQVRLGSAWVPSDGLIILDFNPEVIIVEPTLYTYYADKDGDGYTAENDSIVDTVTTAPAGYIDYESNQYDCNDTVFAINPGAIEILDNDVDENCDGIFGKSPDTTTAVINVLPDDEFDVYSTGSSIHIESDNFDQYTFIITNVIGQVIVYGEFEKEIDVNLDKTNLILFYEIQKDGASLQGKILH